MIGAIAIGVIFGCLLGNLLFQRKLLHRWRMTSRREACLLKIIDGLGEKMMFEGREEAVKHYGKGMVALLDELHNQGRHESDLWPRVPFPGEEWPDFEPAPVLLETEYDFEGPS